MDKALVNGITIEYEIAGTGEPVVLLHGGLLADENRPLLDEAALTDRFQVVSYHRRGFGGSTRTGKSSIEDQAADCLALIDHLDLGPAHLVGHSLGGAIALGVALADPSRVRSLALLEPALMGQIAKVRAQQDPSVAGSQDEFRRAFGEVLAIARTGDKRAALLAFLESRAGEAFRGVLDFLIASGEFDRAVADADTFLQVEMPAAFAWQFTPADAARITQPVLSVLGSRSPERAQLVHRVLSQWIPQTERLVLADAEHALPLMDPPGLAAGLADFVVRQSTVVGQ
jgi:pimeloyl-ACP methyl ester carboxylesterase